MMQILNFNGVHWNKKSYSFQNFVKSDNKLKITASPTFHSFYELVGDTIILWKKHVKVLKSTMLNIKTPVF